MGIRRHINLITATAVLVGSILALVWVDQGSFGACVRGATGENYQKTITALDGLVDLGLKMSTTLTGLGAALLIGLKSGVQLTRGVRLSLFVSSVLFAQSALYAVWWRLGIARSWLNECLNLVVEEEMQRRYEAHFWFFLAGLVAIGMLVFFAAFVRNGQPASAGDST